MEIELVELENQRSHECNPGCYGNVHFDVVFEFTVPVTEIEVRTACEHMDVISCRRVLEYPLVRSVDGKIAIGAHAIVFKWRE